MNVTVFWGEDDKKRVNLTVIWGEDDRKRNIEVVGFSEMSQKMVIYIAIELKFSKVRHAV